MKNIKFLKNSNYISVIFISFAIVTMIQSCLFDMLIYQGVFETSLIYQIFITCCLVSLLMYITDYIFSNLKGIIRGIIRMIDMYVVVFAMQVVFYDNIPLSLLSIFLNFSLLWITYLAVYVVLYIQNSIDAREINKKLKERKR